MFTKTLKRDYWILALMFLTFCAGKEFGEGHGFTIFTLLVLLMVARMATVDDDYPKG